LRRPDGGVIRFAGWLSIAITFTLVFYQAQVATFFQLLDGRLNETFGSSFPALPFAALLSVLFLLRWGDLHGVLLKELGFRSLPWTRGLGLAFVVLPLSFSTYAAGSLEVSAASLILVFYGTALLLNPGTARLLLPYAAMYTAGVTAPGAIQYLVGEPLAGVASNLSAWMVGLTGTQVTWSGTQFALVSRAGELVTGTVTPGCSSVLSITTFLGLLGLMYFDFRKDLRSTLAVAVVGSAALVLLNSLRIGALIFAGYAGGSEALLSLHNWVGYAIFLGFYLVVLVVYSSIGRTGTPSWAGLKGGRLRRVPE